jgi:hypothetical protein
MEGQDGAENHQTFNVGTGLSDKQRKNPPRVGAIITYRFQELTKDGVPRYERFNSGHLSRAETILQVPFIHRGSY